MSSVPARGLNPTPSTCEAEAIMMSDQDDPYTFGRHICVNSNIFTPHSQSIFYTTNPPPPQYFTNCLNRGTNNCNVLGAYIMYKEIRDYVQRKRFIYRTKLNEVAFEQPLIVVLVCGLLVTGWYQQLTYLAILLKDYRKSIVICSCNLKNTCKNLRIWTFYKIRTDQLYQKCIG